MNDLSKRIIMTIIGNVMCGISVGFFCFSRLGVDPFTVFAKGTWIVAEANFGLSYGLVYSVINAIMLVVDAFLCRKKLGVGTLINLFLLGYIVDFTQGLLDGFLPEPTLVIRFVAFVIAIVLLCLASAIYYVGDMGVSAYDAIPLHIADIQSKIPFKFCRVITDIICLSTGFALGARFSNGFVGIGTIMTAFFMGPLIEVFKKSVAIPFRYGKNASLTTEKGEQ